MAAADFANLLEVSRPTLYDNNKEFNIKPNININNGG